MIDDDKAQDWCSNKLPCARYEAQAAEIERLREILKIADEYITDLEQHEGAEGFSVSTYELGKKYEAALGEGND